MQIENVMELVSDFNIQELESVKQKVIELIKSKTTENPKTVIYTHDCYSGSSYHFRKYKHFAKLLTGIDDTKTNGYAFLGKFLKCDKEDIVSVGSYIVEVCDTNLKLYYVNEDDFELKTSGTYKEIISFIKKVKEITGFQKTQIN